MQLHCTNKLHFPNLSLCLYLFHIFRPNILSAVVVFCVGVVIFSVAVVTLVHTVAVVLAAVGHKEKAIGRVLNPRKPLISSHSAVLTTAFICINS